MDYGFHCGEILPFVNLALFVIMALFLPLLIYVHMLWGAKAAGEVNYWCPWTILGIMLS